VSDSCLLAFVIAIIVSIYFHIITTDKQQCNTTVLRGRCHSTHKYFLVAAACILLFHLNVVLKSFLNYIIPPNILFYTTGPKDTSPPEIVLSPITQTILMYNV